MSSLVKALGLDRERWETLRVDRFWPAVALVCGSWVLLSWGRYGGLAISGARPFVGLALVGVYGWLGIAIAMWGFARLERLAGPEQLDHPGVLVALTAVGLAHRPVLALAGFVFLAGLLQLSGPGLVAALLVVSLWLPAGLIRTATSVLRLSGLRAVAAMVVPYALWLGTVARHVMGQVQHML